MFKRLSALALLVTITTGCATPAYQRFVAFPTQGQDPPQTQSDLLECQAIAEGHRGPEVQEAILAAAGTAAIAGALSAGLGAALGAIGTGVKNGALVGAAIGLGAGVIMGVAASINANRARTQSIFVACLEVRHYRVAG